LKVIHQTTSQQDIQGDKMSDYKDGFQDGYKFAREEIMEKLSEIDITDIDTWILDRLAEMIEGGTL
jgi:cytochrome c553